jgi:hypothetical protein
MPLALSLAPTVQSNDATTIRFTDDTGTYAAGTNNGGWGESNYEVEDVVEVTTPTTSKIHLTLQITHTSTTLVATEFDDIDLCASFGPFTYISDLVFNITAADLRVSGTSLGLATDVLPDGWYEFTYRATEAGTGGSISVVVSFILAMGVVRGKVYSALRNVPFSHEFDRFTNNALEWDLLLTPLYLESLYQGLSIDTTESKKTELLNALSTLENLTANVES